MKNILSAVVLGLTAVAAHAQLDAGVVCTQPGLTVPQIECEALVAFYNAADGPNWPDFTPWGSTPDVGDWDGVVVANGRVDRLSRGGNNMQILHGEIAPELGNLGALRVLFLAGVDLVGPIPDSLGNLSALERLTIADSGVSGSVPASFANLNALTDLELIGNLLHGPLPPVLGQMSALEDVSMVGNLFSGPIPPALGNLSNLDRILLDQNRLSGALPDALANLTALAIFSVESNHLDADVNGNALVPPALQSWVLGLTVAGLCCQTPGQQEPPFINGFPPPLAPVGQLYSFTPHAGDANPGDLLTFSALNAPPWAVFDTLTGALSGVPSAADVGVYPNVVIGVSDGTAAVNLPAFTVEVMAGGGNNPPQISGTPPGTASVGVAYAFTPVASDPDVGDVLTFSVQNLPAWCQFDVNSGALSGTPASGDEGLYPNIVIAVSDGQAGAALPPFDVVVSGAPTGGPVVVPGLSRWGLWLMMAAFGLVGVFSLLRRVGGAR